MTSAREVITDVTTSSCSLKVEDKKHQASCNTKQELNQLKRSNLRAEEDEL